MALWEFVLGLFATNTILGWVGAGLLGAFVLVLFAILIREFAALARLGKVEKLHDAANAVQVSGDLAEAKALSQRLSQFYRGRSDVDWGREKLAVQVSEAFDADTVLAISERSLLVPLDARATREVEAATRQVAAVTALVPLAFADVIAALTANIRMIRRIAEIYGGRSGTFGSWRLTRAVITHLVATGAVSVGDDMIVSLGGGHLLGKISRRFGEGMINGALTARVGVAAMEVCRPMPFISESRPRVTQMVRRSLTGLFDQADT